MKLSPWRIGISTRLGLITTAEGMPGGLDLENERGF
jgi:hypothetical protein